MTPFKVEVYSSHNARERAGKDYKPEYVGNAIAITQFQANHTRELHACFVVERENGAFDEVPVIRCRKVKVTKTNIKK